MHFRSRIVSLAVLMAACATGEQSAVGDPPELPGWQETEESQLDQTVRLIERQVAHFGERPHGLSRDYFCATAIMNYVQSRVSPLNYAILARAGDPLPTDPESCLTLQAGICGNQVATFLALAERLRLRARSVEFYLHGKTPEENSSHICAEIFYDGNWRFFDVTWGTVFRRKSAARDDLMSCNEILNLDDPRQHAVANQTDLWFQQWMAAGLDPFVYVDSPDTDVLHGHSGTIHLRPHPDSADGILAFVPVHQPNHFGHPPSSIDGGSVELRLTGISQPVSAVTIDVTGVAGTGTLQVAGADQFVGIPLADINVGLLEIALDGMHVGDQLRFTVRRSRPDDIGYVVFREICLESPAE